MARAYVIRLLGAEFRISGDPDQLADFFDIIRRDVLDSITLQGSRDQSYWDSAPCKRKCDFALDLESYSEKLAPDRYTHNL